MQFLKFLFLIFNIFNGANISPWVFFKFINTIISNVELSHSWADYIIKSQICNPRLLYWNYLPVTMSDNIQSSVDMKSILISEMEDSLECPVCTNVPHCTPIYQVFIVI